MGIIVFDGDSISLGVGASQGHALADHVARTLPDGIAYHVVASGGRPIRDCLALFETTVMPLYRADAGRNVIFFHAGDNDIDQGRGAHETYEALRGYVARAHRQGWLVVVSTELQRYDWPETFRAIVVALNELILDNAAKADGVADFQGDPIMGSHGGRCDPAYYTPDGVHPADLGYAILGRIASESLLPHVLTGAATTSADDGDGLAAPQGSPAPLA